MKKLMNLRCLVAVGDKKYCDTSIWNYIRYYDMEEVPEVVEFHYNTFEEALTAVEEGMIRGAEIYHTLFSNRPYFTIPWGEVYRNDTEITEKNFKPIHVKWEKVEVNKAFTMKDLAGLLPAEMFCEWLKDHGITQIGNF